MGTIEGEGTTIYALFNELLYHTSMYMCTYTCSCVVQETVAPFALENLGCTGNETRIMDCPVGLEDEPVYNDPYVAYEFRDNTNLAICDPYRGTFADIVCGTSTASGTP